MQARAAAMQARASKASVASSKPAVATRRRPRPRPLPPGLWCRGSVAAAAAAAAADDAPAPATATAAAADAPIDAASPKTPPPLLPHRVLAVDYGNVFTGLAVGPGPGAGTSPAPAGTAPTAAAPSLLGGPRPLPAVRSQGHAVGLLARDVVAEARRQGAAAVLVGVPLRRGQRLAHARSDTPQAARCREFAHNAALAGGGAVDVYIYDESGTTADALRRLRVPMERREALTRRDKMAREVDGWSAAALLEAFCARPRRALRVRAAVEVAGGGEGEAQEEVQEEGRRRKEPSRDDDAER